MRRDIESEGFGSGYYENYPSDGLRLRLYLSKKLEEHIKEISGVEGRVSDLTFAYCNSWLIDKLRQRGQHIINQKWDDLNKINEEITKDIHDNMDKVIEPKCAFVSIETEEAYNILSEAGDKGKINICGYDSKVQEAVEPTNVIWENRDFDKSIRW